MAIWTVAVAGLAQGRQAVDDGRFQPDHALAVCGGLRLEANGAERERGGYRVIGGWRDGVADHVEGLLERDAYLEQAAVTGESGPRRSVARRAVTPIATPAKRLGRHLQSI